MAQIISFIVSFIIVQIVFWITKQRLKIKELEIEIKRVKSEKNIEVIALKNQNSILQAQVCGLMKMGYSKSKDVAADTIQAVKYAMKHAHLITVGIQRIL